MATATIERSDDQIRALLCNAFEGGSNYWYSIVGYQFADGLCYNDFRAGGKMQIPGDYWHPAELIPLAAGCALIIVDLDSPDNPPVQLLLDRDVLARGVQVMAEKYPRHFSNWVSENDDATTGDVFLQCCLFGEAVYG